MITRLLVVVLAGGLLSIGGVSKDAVVTVDIYKAVEEVNIVDGIQYIDIKTPIVITPRSL